MSTSYKNLVERANRGSKSSVDELSKRKYKDTGLRGINNEKLVIRNSNELVDNCSYILREIKNIRVDETVSESIMLDSFNSATIEGARTTVDSVKETFHSPISKDDKMVVNAIKAQCGAYNMGISNNNIRSIWETLTLGVLENEGADGVKYRSEMVYIGNPTKIIHIPEKPDKIELRMDSLFNFCEGNKNTIIKAGIVHFYFVYIHPFCDGNGRFARLWMNSILASINSNFKGLVISREINNNLMEYYNSITESEFSYNGLMDITTFLEYMTRCIVNAVDYMKYKRYNRLSDIEQIVYNKIRKNKSGISVKKLSSIMRVNKNKARVILNSLVDKRYLVVDKSSREYKYCIKQ